MHIQMNLRFKFCWQVYIDDDYDDRVEDNNRLTIIIF